MDLSPADGVAAALVGRHAARIDGLGPERRQRLLSFASGVPLTELAALSDRSVSTLLHQFAGFGHALQTGGRAAMVDGLTGVTARDSGLVAMEQQVELAARTGGVLCVAYVDVDGLKRVNDTDGHAAGDELLAAVGRSLRSRVRKSDVVVRMGGDEFVCMFPGTPRVNAAQVMADVATGLAARLPGATISFGVAERKQGERLPALLERADAALLQGRSDRNYRGRD